MKRMIGGASLAVLSAVLIAGPENVQAAQEMRQGVPAVLTPREVEPLPDPTPAINAFREENKRVKRPRFVVFWNRDLSDEVVTYYIDYQARGLEVRTPEVTRERTTTTNMHTHYNGQLHGEREVRDTVRGNPGSVSAQAYDYSGTVRLNKDQARKNLEEILNWKVQGGFKNLMIKGGARLIDRDMINRVEGAGAQSNEQVNTHAIEINAMLGKADYMIEVLLAPSAESESGLAFQVNVVQIETGETITSMYSDAMPPTREVKQYEATRNGFKEYYEVEGYSEQRVGEELAIRTMMELTDYWRMMADS
ncbi:hypothetical protein [Kordiimonas gwangyangensis]|uniref:hypothetical protein n=1 Tax=Kordiimonas gwangyangensis TaxID=288022 RepID=UPI00037C73FD|nr:hypothetical protein [Kordiimonas gwangyangensis]